MFEEENLRTTRAIYSNEPISSCVLNMNIEVLSSHRALRANAGYEYTITSYSIDCL